MNGNKMSLVIGRYKKFIIISTLIFSLNFISVNLFSQILSTSIQIESQILKMDGSINNCYYFSKGTLDYNSIGEAIPVLDINWYGYNPSNRGWYFRDVFNGSCCIEAPLYEWKACIINKVIPYETLLYIVTLDVLNFYDLASKYDTELKLAVFKESQEYKDKLEKLKQIKNSLNNVYFRVPLNKFINIQSDNFVQEQGGVDINQFKLAFPSSTNFRLLTEVNFGNYIMNKKGFDCTITEDYRKGYSNTEIFYNGLKFNTFPWVSNNETNEIFIPMNTNDALDFENSNKDNIGMDIIFKLTGDFIKTKLNYLYVYGNDSLTRLTVNDMRIIVYNNLSQKIYFQKNYNPNGATQCTLQKTNITTSTAVNGNTNNNTQQSTLENSNVSTTSANNNSFTDPRDGKVYKTVTIGTQTWLAENLAYKASSGCWAYNDDINKIMNLQERADDTLNSSKSLNNLAIYGYLYTWEAAKNACPSGWHLPSDDEWKTLTKDLGGEEVAGGKMKEEGTTHWSSPNNGATNSSGFTALPGGQRSTMFDFTDIGNHGYWWSSTAFVGGNITYPIKLVWCRYLYSDYAALVVGNEDSHLVCAYSVRCVKDNNNDTQQGTIQKTNTTTTTSANGNTNNIITPKSTLENSNINTTTANNNSFTDPRDGKVYKTVTIGTQTWMAENLAYKASSGCSSYDNDQTNVDIYGYLYNWESAKVVCPAGWHLPTDAEWTILTDYLGGGNVAGDKLKSTSTWTSPKTGVIHDFVPATNSSGFSALPGGFIGSSGTFHMVGNNGYWWSSTETSTVDAQSHAMYYSGSSVGSYSSHKTNGFSVRCIKDNNIQENNDKEKSKTNDIKSNKYKESQEDDNYKQGQSDAIKYYKGYKGYKGAGTATCLISSFLTPFIGLIPAVICSSTMPNDNHLKYPNETLFHNPEYSAGYKITAHKIKSKEVWKNWWIVTGAYTLYILLAEIAQSH